MKDVSGWYCPRCKGVNAPFVLKCDCKKVFEVRIEGNVSDVKDGIIRSNPDSAHDKEFIDLIDAGKALRKNVPFVDFDRCVYSLFPNFRISKSLRKEGINTAGDLMKLSWSKIVIIKNIVSRSANLMREILDELNIVLEER